MRRGTTQPIGEVLKNVVEKLGRTKSKAENKIFSAWASFCGKELVHHTKPVRLKKGTLLVLVEDSAWFYQANMQREEILKSLQKKIGQKQIQRIQFRMDSASFFDKKRW